MGGVPLPGPWLAPAPLVNCIRSRPIGLRRRPAPRRPDAQRPGLLVLGAD